MSYFIGLDIGTSSTKAVIVDVEGNVLAHARRGHSVIRARPGWAEHDPEEHWWAGAVHLVEELLGRSGVSADAVAGIGCSGVCPIVLPVDKHGTPLRNAILYSIDRRALPEAAAIEQQLGRKRVIADSGQPLSSQAVVPKLVWLQNNEPDVWGRTDKVLGATGYLVHRMCGEMVVDHFTAGDGGLGYALAKEAWNKDILAEVNVAVDVFPRLAWPTEVVGTLQAEAAMALGLREGTPVVAGTGDALAEMIAAGVHEVGETALLYGSTMTTMTMIDEPWLHEGFITVPGWRPHSLITSAVLGTGAELLNWWSRVIDRPIDERLMRQFDETASSVPVGAEGLTVIPYLTGQRSPQVNPDMRGAFFGLEPSHGPGHFARALMEGAAYALRSCLQEIPVRWRPRQMFAAGGGTSSETFLQIVSDVCDVEQQVCDTSVSAAVGSAYLAAVGTGALQEDDGGSLPVWSNATDTIVADEAVGSAYGNLYEGYTEILALVEKLSL